MSPAAGQDPRRATASTELTPLGADERHHHDERLCISCPAWRAARRQPPWLSRSACGLGGLSVAAAACLLAAAPPAAAASPPVSNPRTVVHFDFSRGQTPENLALEPDGTADVTFAEAAQVARVSPGGQVRILAQLPEPADGAACPVLGPLLRAPALTVGIVRDHTGSLYVALCTGSPDQQGIWRVSPAGSARRIAALPADGIPNGMALDQRHGFIYVADSLLSVIWRVPIAGGTASAWVRSQQLAPNGGLGANGLKLHDGAVWVSNTQLGTLMRIPIRHDGSAGRSRPPPPACPASTTLPSPAPGLARQSWPRSTASARSC